MASRSLALRGSDWDRRREYNEISAPQSEAAAADINDPFADDAGTISSDGMSISGDSRTRSLVPATNADVFLERNRIFDDIANKSLQPAETELLIEKFRGQRDIPFTRTYKFGNAQGQELPNTVQPQVGLVFLPGGDLPEVTRLEMHGMVEREPNQRDARWRVNTAARLLSVSFVSRDLSVITHDITEGVVDRTRWRLEHKPIADRSRRQDLSMVRRDAVTIDSEQVALCRDLHNQELDISATLIEVNVSSLMAMMWDYRWVISTGGPRLSQQQTKDLLDRMIEAARRFCLNSPILFRMSTRNRIIDASDIRYGVDNEQGFQTFTTSKGIQEIIMMSASYFNSLDPSAPGMDQFTQREIRPRFLQMLTLLLSLLNEADLETMAQFIERTYGINPNRHELELLFCKVIPLTSINPKVFLEALIPAVHGTRITAKGDAFNEKIWETFLIRLARKGYLLPGTLDDLGHPRLSWMTKWPEEGIRSTTAFRRLQLHGSKIGTFNEIPAARFHFESSLAQLTVMLTDHETYTIHPDDHDRISTLTAGFYNVTKAENETICDLEISEDVINKDINEAIRVINDAIRQFNASQVSSTRSRRSGVLRRKRVESLVFSDIEAAARLTRNQAMLPGKILAVAYKLDGKNVPKSEALRHLSDQYSKAVALFNHLCESAGSSVKHFERHIADVRHFFRLDRQVHTEEKARANLSDSPIARAYHPDDGFSKSTPVWFSHRVEYKHDPRTDQELLHITAKCDIVSTILWRQAGTQAEVRLAQIPTIFFVSPLKPVSEDQQGEEIRVRDLALLVGRYMVIAAPNTSDASLPCIMMNWLEIQEALPEQDSRRGRNLRGAEELPMTAFW